MRGWDNVKRIFKSKIHVKNLRTKFQVTARVIVSQSEGLGF